VGGEPDYLHGKDAVIISPVHVASLAAAPPPYPRRGPTLRSTIPDMEGCSNNSDMKLKRVMICDDNMQHLGNSDN